MTRTYDNNLSGPYPFLIANGVMQMLAPLSKQATPQLFAQKIFRFPYILKPYVNDEAELGHFEMLLDGANCAYAVAIGDSKSIRVGAAGMNQGKYELEVYCYSDNMRGMVPGRLGPDARALVDVGADPGVDVMQELARMYLSDQNVPGLGQSDILHYEGSHHVATSYECTLWALRFSIAVNLRVNLLRDATVYLTELFTKHHIGAGNTPDTATPDLIQTLTETSG